MSQKTLHAAPVIITFHVSRAVPWPGTILLHLDTPAHRRGRAFLPLCGRESAGLCREYPLGKRSRHRCRIGENRTISHPPSSMPTWRAGRLRRRGVCDTPPYRKTHDVVTVAPPRRRANCRPRLGAGAGVNGRARSRLRVALSRATPLYLVSPRDIRIRQPGAYSLPRDLETGHAVLKTGALPAIAVQR